MAASVPLAAMAVLTAAFTSWNTATSNPQQRVSGYNGGVQGIPTDRYFVVFGSSVTLRRGSFGPAAADASGILTVHFMSSRPNSFASAANESLEMARVGNAALVDNTLTVDGLSPGIFLDHVTTEPPIDVSTVADRVTSQVTSQFTFIANRV